MRDYRLNFLGFDGRVTHAQAIRCRDDLDALARGERIACSESIEIWDKNRIVARVKPANAPLLPGDFTCL